MNTKTLHYLITFLMQMDSAQDYVAYSKIPAEKPLTIIQGDFFDDGVYGTKATLPETPFPLLPGTDISFLFGSPKVERTEGGRIVLYADLVASAYFMLFRYEEIIKPECRDQHGRFLAEHSVVFQQGYGMRPLVDEWGRYLRGLLREAGTGLPEEKSGFQKIYLTHDVDTPFLLYRKEQVVKQWIKNAIHRGKPVPHPLSVYRNPQNDRQYTFPKIIERDKWLRERLGNSVPVESIYFLIARGSAKTKEYCSVELPKYKRLLELLSLSGATLGLHVSHEAGENPELLSEDMNRLKKYCPNAATKSRHHFLKWLEGEHVAQMEKAGITEDFTLGYADSVGFRVGTCKPYRFINPRTQEVTNVLIHPMQIMECSLDRPNYMGLSYQDALKLCKQLCDVTKEYGGELVLLFHNPIWQEGNYYGPLYDALLEYLAEKIGGGYESIVN